MMLLVAAATVLIALLGAAGLLLVGLRTGNRTVFRLVRTLQRDILNPRQLSTAGLPGSPWAVVRHCGRVSGRPYATPVGAVRTATGFLIALPYGTRPDWVRNVRSGTSASLLADGHEHRIDGTTVVSIVDTPMAETMSVTIRIFGIRSALAVTTTPLVRADGPEPR